MEQERWDYSPLITDSSQQTELFGAVLAHCKIDNATLTAVSESTAQANRIIKRKYRNHAKRHPGTHPIPRQLAIAGGQRGRQ